VYIVRGKIIPVHPAIKMAKNKKAAAKASAAKAKAKAAPAPAPREDRIYIEHNMGDAFGPTDGGRGTNIDIFAFRAAAN
jgi:hypothetical protein